MEPWHNMFHTRGGGAFSTDKEHLWSGNVLLLTHIGERNASFYHPVSRLPLDDPTFSKVISAATFLTRLHASHLQLPHKSLVGQMGPSGAKLGLKGRFSVGRQSIPGNSHCLTAADAICKSISAFSISLLYLNIYSSSLLLIFSVVWEAASDFP